MLPPLTIIHVKPRGRAWQVCASSGGVKAYFVGNNASEKALAYAKERRSATGPSEIRILNRAGEITETFPPVEGGV